jgi:hypothetical protein
MYIEKTSLTLRPSLVVCSPTTHMSLRRVGVDSISCRNEKGCMSGDGAVVRLQSLGCS